MSIVCFTKINNVPVKINYEIALEQRLLVLAKVDVQAPSNVYHAYFKESI